MFFDLHNDFATVISPNNYNGYLHESACGGIVTAAIFTTELEKNTAVKTVKDITAALVPTGMPIAIEDMGFIGDEYKNFDFSPYLYCSPTWNYNNDFAGGALDDGTLTKVGRDLIERINSFCALDLAHLNKKSFFAALDASRYPICSHTGFNDHPRSLDAAQIRALIDRRGVIGLCAVKNFTDAYSCAELGRVIDGFVQKYGMDYLCLGTDFLGSKNLPADFADYADMKTLRSELGKLGYDDRSINKILYENANRFYEEINNARHLRKSVDNQIRR